LGPEVVATQLVRQANNILKHKRAGNSSAQGDLLVHDGVIGDVGPDPRPPEHADTIDVAAAPTYRD
jgi:hypothetical protein